MNIVLNKELLACLLSVFGKRPLVFLTKTHNRIKKEAQRPNFKNPELLLLLLVLLLLSLYATSNLLKLIK